MHWKLAHRQEFRIGGPMPTQAPAPEPSASALSISESGEVSRFLLNTGRHVLDAEFMASLESAIQSYAQPKPEFDMSQWMEPAEDLDEFQRKVRDPQRKRRDPR